LHRGTIILKRLATDARKQDWFAVVVEPVVVVLGIFVGLQVTDWNEGRKSARLSDEYRSSLIADLTADAVTAGKRTAYFETAQVYGTQALAYLDSPTPQVSADEAAALVTAFMLASTVWDYRQPRSTFEDLKATGNLALLGNMGLRIELAAYYVTTDQKSVGRDSGRITGHSWSDRRWPSGRPTRSSFSRPRRPGSPGRCWSGRD
jgi:hypothetical protein